MSVGAQPSEPVARLLGLANVLPIPPTRQSVPKKKKEAWSLASYGRVSKCLSSSYHFRNPILLFTIFYDYSSTCSRYMEELVELGAELWCFNDWGIRSFGLKLVALAALGEYSNSRFIEYINSPRHSDDIQAYLFKGSIDKYDTDKSHKILIEGTYISFLETVETFGFHVFRTVTWNPNVGF